MRTALSPPGTSYRQGSSAGGWLCIPLGSRTYATRHASKWACLRQRDCRAFCPLTHPEPTSSSSMQQATRRAAWHGNRRYAARATRRHDARGRCTRGRRAGNGLVVENDDGMGGRGAQWQRRRVSRRRYYAKHDIWGGKTQLQDKRHCAPAMEDACQERRQFLAKERRGR